MYFTDPADHKENKRKRKDRQVSGSCQRAEKGVKNEVGSDINCICKQIDLSQSIFSSCILSMNFVLFQWILYSIQWILYPIQWILYSIQWILDSIQWILDSFNEFCTPFNEFWTLSMNFVLHSMNFVPYSMNFYSLNEFCTLSMNFVPHSMNFLTLTSLRDQTT